MQLAGQYKRPMRILGLVLVGYGLGLLALRVVVRATGSHQPAPIIDGRKNPTPAVKQHEKVTRQPVKASRPQRGPSEQPKAVSQSTGSTGTQEGTSWSIPFRFHNLSQETPQVIIGAWWRREDIWSNPPDHNFVLNFSSAHYAQTFQNQKVLLVGVKDKGDCREPVELTVLPKTAQAVEITIGDDAIKKCLRVK